VREQVAGGRKLLSHFREQKFEVMAACWAKPDDEGRLHLYIVSPLVQTLGRPAAYGAAFQVLDSLQAGWVDEFERIDSGDLKLLAPDQALARALLEHNRLYPDLAPTWHGGLTLGSMSSIEAAYIYPASMFARSAI